MTNSVKNVIAVFASLMLAVSGMAGETSKLTKTRLAANKDVKLGVWHASLSKCRSYAAANGVPLIAVWSNGDLCGHCVMFESACNSSVFRTWMKNSGCVFMFVYSGDKDGKQGGSVYNWCYKNQSRFPLIRIYWYKNGKKQIDEYTMGDTLDGTKGETAGGKSVRDWLKKKLAKYKYKPTPAAPKYNGGGFDVDDEENARLEVEVGVTKSVTMPLTRGDVASTTASTNTVIATYPDGTVVTNTVAWDAGDDTAELTFDTSSLTNAGEKVELVMLDAAGKAVATNHITAVAEVENSPKNPLWIGEKTPDELKWGEWTMDIDAATNKVAAHNRSQGVTPLSAGRPSLLSTSQRAYTLVLVGGSLWCPDCFRAEEYLFGTDEFKTWATNKNVACVAIDEPRFGSSKNPSLDRPTLLTRKSYSVAYNGVTNLTSGAGYLSRKGIGDAEAEEILARNLAFVTNDTAHGGFCLPDNLSGSGNTGSWKTGIPCILALRSDGSVAGRLFQFSNSTSPLASTPDVASVLTNRLDELFAQVTDEDEELNDSRYTTPDEIGLRESISDRTLSFTDTADVYRIKPEVYGNRMKFSVSGPTDATMLLRVLRVSPNVVSVESESSAPQNSEEGLSVSADIPADTNLQWFVSVGYPADANAYPFWPEFALTNAASTVHAYTLSSDFVVKPDETTREVTVDDLAVGLTMALESNKVYRITGIDASANGETLVPVAGTTDRYTALVTGDEHLTLSSAKVAYQLWNPGTVGFATTSAFASEAAGTYELRLVRKGGVSGTATASVSFNDAKLSADDIAKDPEKLATLIELPESLSDLLTWEEGDDSERTIPLKINDNKFADGDHILYFSAACGGDAEAGIVEFRLTLRDNDKKVPGKLEISQTTPALGKAMETFVRAGETMDVTLSRVDGADGELSATLAASAGTLGETAFAWPGRNADDQTTTLGLPDEVGKKVTVTLTPAKGTSVSASKRILKVNLLDPNVPGFERDAVAISNAVRYVPIAETRVKLDDKDATAVKKFSGALATGLKWAYDKGARELVISGVPTARGTSTAVFRAYNGGTAGLTVAVTVVVTDPVTAGGGEGAAAPLNPSVAKTRTFADVPMYAVSGNRLAGILTLTLPRTGRASAKYRTVDGTASLSTASWDAIGPDGTLAATLSGKLNGADCTLAVEVLPDGSVDVELDDPRYPDGVAGEIPGNVWSKANPATDFKGYYTVSMPQKETLSGNVLSGGDAYVTLKMNTAAAINSGKFAYAGVLPNGKAFSGSAALAPKDWISDKGFEFWKRAVLPLLAATSSDALAGVLQLTPGAYDLTAMDLDEKNEMCEGRCSYKQIRRSVRPADDCQATWRHVEKADAASCEAALDAFGTWYNSAEDFASCCSTALGTTKLTLFALPSPTLPGEVADALAAGATDTKESAAVAGVNVTYAKATKSAKTKTNGIVSANTKNLTLSFTLSTGIVTGTFVRSFENKDVKVTYQGVVMPGWGSQECGDCGLGGKEASYRPFISGTAWFNDTLTYTDVNERVRTVTVRRSCPISVGVKPGE